MEWLYVTKFMKSKFNQHVSNFRHHMPKSLFFYSLWTD